MDEKDLVKKYGYLVIKAATKYYPRFKRQNMISIEDLIGMGFIGLLEAAGRYKKGEDFSNKFATFAFHRIRGNILDGTNQFLDIKKKKKHNISIINVDDGEIDQFASEQSDIVNEIYKKEVLRLIDYAIEKYLTPRERVAISLRYKYKMKTQEIAKNMKITNGRVIQLCNSGIEKLKDKLNLEEIQNGKKKVKDKISNKTGQNRSDKDSLQVS